MGRPVRRASRSGWTCFQLPSPAGHRDLLTLQNGCSRNPGTRWRARCLVAHLRRRQPAGAPSRHRQKAGVQSLSVGLQTTWQSELDFTAGSLLLNSLQFLAKFSEVPLRQGKVRARSLVVLVAARMRNSICRPRPRVPWGRNLSGVSGVSVDRTCPS